MKLPEFNAEVSLYKSKNQYISAGRYSQNKMALVGPSMLDEKQRMMAEWEKSDTDRFGPINKTFCLYYADLDYYRCRSSTEGQFYITSEGKECPCSPKNPECPCSPYYEDPLELPLDFNIPSPKTPPKRPPKSPKKPSKPET